MRPSLRVSFSACALWLPRLTGRRTPALAGYDKLPAGTLAKQHYLDTAQRILDQALSLQAQVGGKLDIIGYLSRGASPPLLLSLPSPLTAESLRARIRTEG